jgi:hypothetical protein
MSAERRIYAALVGSMCACGAGWTVLDLMRTVGAPDDQPNASHSLAEECQKPPLHALNIQGVGNRSALVGGCSPSPDGVLARAYQRRHEGP